MEVDIEPLTDEIAREAARLRARHGPLRLPDAVVIATANNLGAAVVLTTDRKWARLSPLVRVI